MIHDSNLSIQDGGSSYCKRVEASMTFVPVCRTHPCHSSVSQFEAQFTCYACVLVIFKLVNNCIEEVCVKICVPISRDKILFKLKANNYYS